MKHKKQIKKEHESVNDNETQKTDQKQHESVNDNETQKTDQKQNNKKITSSFMEDSIPESDESNFILQSPISLTYYDSNDDEHAIFDDDLITPSELSEDEKTSYTLST